jgi:hypothetical protein
MALGDVLLGPREQPGKYVVDLKVFMVEKMALGRKYLRTTAL